MSLITVFILYLVFRLKQLVCDYFLQTHWMAIGKGIPGWAGYTPLAAHVAIHGVGTAFVFLIFAPALWWMGIVDFVVHGAIDRIRALMIHDHHWTPSNWKFWWSFGVDQELHNLTHLSYMLILIAYLGGINV